MQRILIALGLLAMLLLTACNSSGTLQVINRTSFPVYFTVEGHHYTIQAQQSKSVEIETGTQTWFSGVKEKDVPIEIYGETWMIRLWVDDEPVYVKNTTVRIRSGEKTKIYCDPILACIKVRNHGELSVKALTYTVHQPPFGEFSHLIDLPDSIATGEEFFAPLEPASAENQFYFTFHLMMEDGSWLNYGDASTILYADQEYVIDVLYPSKDVVRLKKFPVLFDKDTLTGSLDPIGKSRFRLEFQVTDIQCGFGHACNSPANPVLLQFREG